MNRDTYLGKVNTSLVHFLVLTIFASAVTLFLVYKADEATADLDSFSSVSLYKNISH